MALLMALLARHPLHTTMTEVTLEAARADGQVVVRAVVRGFTDDLRAAAGGAAVDAYVATRFTIASNGRRVVLASCGVRRSADVSWVCVQGSVATEAADLIIENSLLTERFPDQVNVVQVSAGGERRTLLYTPASRVKHVALR